jgi:multiple sugar transport system ATP-binding protein
MANVVLRQVTKRYGPVEAVRGINLEIGAGSFVALVGPSGCGKSTTLRMIAGLEDISGGDISIGGRVVSDLLPKDRDIAMVFQNYALYPHMTVANNMAFALKQKRIDKAEIKSRVDRAVDILELRPLLDRYPRQLSGGQRQRVAMGRAIVRDPKVFLFDEPLSNLDAKLRVQMRTEIKKLHQRIKATTVYVTHDQIEAMTLADKIVVMRDGIIEQAGAPLELYDMPANRFVAQFIGSPAMNLLNGTLEADGFRTSDGVLLPAPADVTAPGTRAIYGIRPEDITIAEDGIEAVVEVIEPTGAEIQVFANIGQQPVSAVVRQRIRANPGDVIRLKPDFSKIHLFEADAAGRRL